MGFETFRNEKYDIDLPRNAINSKCQNFELQSFAITGPNVCQKMFTRKYSLQRHKASFHGTAESREKKTLKRRDLQSSKKDTTKTIDGLRNHIHESMEEKPQDKMR